MSEPVGNAPRASGDIPNIPGNSHKEREAKQKEQKEQPTEREPLSRLVEGKVVSRKKPWWKRWKNSLVAEDSQDMGEYIMTEFVIPSLKNLVADAINGYMDRMLFGSSRHRGRGMILGDRRASPIRTTRYDLVTDRDRDRDPRRTLSHQARATHDFDDIVLEHRSDAIDVVETMIDRVRRFGNASVADLYDLVGITPMYTDQRWGWTNLDTANVRQVHGGFLLDLPRTEPIR